MNEIDYFDEIKVNLKINSFNLGNVKKNICSNTIIRSLETFIDNIITTNNKISTSLDKLGGLISDHDEKLNNRINKLEEYKRKSILNSLRKHLKISINDLTEICDFKKIDDEKFNQDILNLKCSRDSDAHYIRTKDTKEMKKYKMKLIKDKLLQYKELNGRNIFPDKLLYILSNEIQDLDINKLDENEKENAEDWWDE